MNTAAHEALHEAPPTLRSSVRVDLFGPIHKAIRHALSSLLVRMGSTTFADAEAARAVVRELDEVLQLCEDHRGIEDRFILPALDERLRQPLRSVADDHATQPRVVSELRALGETLMDTLPERRPLAGRTLYLHFSTFTAELLLHMAEEEQMVQPLLERLFTDPELDAIRGRLLASMSGPEKMLSARYMLPALDRVERATLAAGALASMPREVGRTLVDLARRVLTPEDFADLEARIGLTGHTR